MPPGLTPATADAGISHSCVTSSQTAASQGVVGTSVGAGGGKSPRKRGWGWGGVGVGDSGLGRKSVQAGFVLPSLRDALCWQAAPTLTRSIEVAAKCRQLNSQSKFAALNFLSATSAEPPGPNEGLVSGRGGGSVFSSRESVAAAAAPRSPGSLAVLQLSRRPVGSDGFLFHHRHQRRGGVWWFSADFFPLRGRESFLGGEVIRWRSLICQLPLNSVTVIQKVFLTFHEFLNYGIAFYEEKQFGERVEAGCRSPGNHIGSHLLLYCISSSFSKLLCGFTLNI